MDYNDFFVGAKFGRWTVINQYPIKDGKIVRYLCKCDCGTQKYVMAKTLANGKSKSCGCLTREKFQERITKHGHSRSNLYNVWAAMRYRCNNPKCNVYSAYGGRGIAICDEWNDFAIFEKWAYENGYNDNLGGVNCSLDRINVNGNYCPSNCRWITMKEQQYNRQSTIKITYNGETHNTKEWSSITGVSEDLIRHRVKRGYPVEDILFYGNLSKKRERDSLGRFI